MTLSNVWIVGGHILSCFLGESGNYYYSGSMYLQGNSAIEVENATGRFATIPNSFLSQFSISCPLPQPNPFTNFFHPSFLLLLTFPFCLSHPITSHLISCTIIIHDPQDEHVGATRFLQEFHKPVNFLQEGKQVLHQTCTRLLPLSPFFDSASTFGNAHKQSMLCRCVNFCLERQLEC